MKRMRTIKRAAASRILDIMKDEINIVISGINQDTGYTFLDFEEDRRRLQDRLDQLYRIEDEVAK
jgi:hypothetical protein